MFERVYDVPLTETERVGMTPKEYRIFKKQLAKFGRVPLIDHQISTPTYFYIARIEQREIPTD